MSPALKRAAALWLFCYSALCYANTTFAQDVQAYDWPSLGFALLAGLLGGAGRTVVTLMQQTHAVGNTRWLLAKDLAVAVVGGGVMFLVIEGYNVVAESLHWLRVDRGLRVIVIVWAGYGRGKWVGIIDAFAQDLIDRARAKIRGGEPITPMPSVVSVEEVIQPPAAPAESPP